jgi:hypothetical protein
VLGVLPGFIEDLLRLELGVIERGLLERRDLETFSAFSRLSAMRASRFSMAVSNGFQANFQRISRSSRKMPHTQMSVWTSGPACVSFSPSPAARMGMSIMALGAMCDLL